MNNQSRKELLMSYVVARNAGDQQQASELLKEVKNQFTEYEFGYIERGLLYIIDGNVYAPFLPHVHAAGNSVFNVTAYCLGDPIDHRNEYLLVWKFPNNTHNRNQNIHKSTIGDWNNPNNLSVVKMK